MSIPALNWAFELPIRGAGKSVLLALANAANDDGIAWPSTARLAAWSGVAKRHVIRVLADLEAAGLLVVNRRDRATSTYRLVIGAQQSGDAVSLDGKNQSGDMVSQSGDKSARANSKSGDMVSNSGDTTSSEPLEPPRKKENHQNQRAHTREGDPPGFAAFWAAYPRKVGRGQAIRAYRGALSRTDEATLLMAIVHYPFDRTRPQFIPHASTWLNGQRWMDQIEAPEDDDARLLRAAGLLPISGHDLDGEANEIFPRRLN